MKKKTAIFVSVLIALSVVWLTGCNPKSDATSNEASKKPLVVAMELAYPPFETKDDAGNPTGISVDFAKAFGDSLGREIVIENTAWDGLLPSLQTDKADFVISSMTISDSRKEIVDFSKPYANAALAILANKNANITSIDDLNQAGKKVAVKIGSTGDMYAKANLGNAEIISLPDESACVMEVSQGKVDGFLYDQLTIYRNNQKNLDTTSAIFIPFQDPEYWGVALKKGNTELQTQLNTFIDDYTAKGGFEQLTQKYLSEEKNAFDALGFQWFFDIK